MALNDGLATAPTNTPQLPTLLDGYAARPTWSVAGVDYAVGYSSGTTLSNPSTISMAGVSVDQANHIINVSGSNVTLSGYDFSLDGGWGVSVNGGSNIAIENSKFVVGSNGNTPIYVSQNASNVTIQNNLIDGAGSSSQMLIAADGAGTTTIQYNMIQNAWGQNLVMSSDVGGETWIVQYNVIKDAGLGYEQGAHGDWIQTYNLPGKNTAEFEVNFNTFVQTAPISDGRTQGISAFSANSGSDAGGVQHESFNNNTFIAKNDAYVNYGIILDTSRLIGTATIQDNYFDTTNIGSANGGGGGWEYVGKYNGSSGGPYSGTVTQSNNVNMTAGTYFDQSGTPPTGSSTPTTSAPAAPTITSFSTDSGVAGDHITNDNTLTLTGTAAAGSAVKLFDGSTQVGSVSANSSGAWALTTTALSNGSHSLTATATNSGGTSSASAALSVAIDTLAPSAPTIAASPTAAAATLAATSTETQGTTQALTGTAEANSTVAVFDGTTKIGTATANATGAWSYTTAVLSTGSHSFTAAATDVAGNTGAASKPVVVTVSAPTTAPAAPTIASYSTDSGVAGDGVTNDNTVELKGGAAAGSTVKIYDGSTQIGSTTATSTGSWDYITKVLTDAKHTLTATATNSSGQNSVASAALAVTIDTKAPAAPTIAKDTVNSSNQAVVSGTAEANSAIKVYDGTTQVGTATTNSSGAWSLTTSALAAGSHVLTAKATDVAGNVSAASTTVDPVIGSGTSGSTGSGTSGSGASGTGTSGSGTSGSGTSGSGTSGTGTTAPAAPKIGSFSTDSGVAGDHITNDKTLTLAGTAAANSTVKVFDGATQLGIVTADANGAWHYSTAALPDGKHSFTATDTVSGLTSKASTALDVTVDTAAPDAPVLLSDPTTHNRATVSGTAEAGSLIKLYEGTTLLGTATVASDGDWSVTTPNLKHGSHTFTAKATDAAGNTSALSQPIDPPIGSHSGNGTSTVEVTNVRPHWDHTATIKGTADPNSQIKLFDGTTSVGSVTAGDNGKWSFHTSDLSGKSHAFTAEEVDTTGHVVGTSSGEAIIGSGRSNTLTGTPGNDIMVGKRGADTFEFASNFGHDVIKDFAARGAAHDTIEFSKGVFDSFASVLSHAAQSGHDVVIATGSDTLTLKNTQLDKLNSHDFHFA